MSALKQTHTSMKQKKEPRNKPMHIWSNNILTKEPRIHNGERTVSSINGIGKIGQPHSKEQNWTTFLKHTQKLTQNGLKT